MCLCLKAIWHRPLLAFYNCFLIDLVRVCFCVGIQVRARSHEIWNGEEGLEKEKERRLQSREKKKLKKYTKEVKGKMSEVLHVVFHSSNSCQHSKTYF